MYAELKQKVCTKCLAEKPETEFSARSSRKVGKASQCKECLNQWRREYKRNNKAKYQQYEAQRGLRRHYKLSVLEYNKMLQDQQGKCACCGKFAGSFKRALHVDHDHSTGQVRALLCTRCNPGLGYFEDSIEKLEMAIAYLKKFKKTE